MKMNVKFFFLFFISFCSSFAQNSKHFLLSDSLKGKDYSYLKNAFEKNIESENYNKAEIYGKSILIKGKADKDENIIVDGFLLLYKSTRNHMYLDSMIIVSKKSNDSKNFSVGYLYKGNYYFKKSEYTKALENYLQARNYSGNNKDIYFTANFNIGLLKLELGSFDEAQDLFLNYKKYLEDNNFTKRSDYISCLYAIAYTYSKMNRIDLSESYLKIGLKKAVASKDNENYVYLLFVSGINDFKKKKFTNSIKTLEKVSMEVKKNSYDIQIFALSQLYIGKSLIEQDNFDYINKFKIVDSVIFKTKNLTNDLREAYPKLIEYYKNIDDKEKQLFYIEHLLEVDTLINKNEIYLTNSINKKYDTPNLLKEKEKLISELGTQNSTLVWISSLVGVLLVILLILIYKYIKRIKFYKEQALLLITANVYTIEKEQNEIDKVNNEVINPEKRKNKSTISEEVIQSLKIKFEEFEKNNGFLNRNLSLENLAKEFQTNRDYLSKAVNEIKGKNFSNYINEQRINYIVEELKTNKQLQLYTLEAICEIAGFNNSESFAKAFKKITGTLPSYYLKALKNAKQKKITLD